MGGVEAGFAGEDPQVAEQGGVVHPVEDARGGRLEQWGPAAGQDKEVPFAPVDGGVLVGLAHAADPLTGEDKEEGAGGAGCGAHPFPRFDANEVGGETGAGGGATGAELAAEVQRKNAAGPAAVEIGTPAAVGNRFGQAAADRVRGLPVIKQLGLVGHGGLLSGLALDVEPKVR